MIKMTTKTKVTRKLIAFVIAIALVLGFIPANNAKAQSTCPTCSGTGSVPSICPTCYGLGCICLNPNCSGACGYCNGNPERKTKPCSNCGGTGISCVKSFLYPCLTCSGTGSVTKTCNDSRFGTVTLGFYCNSCGYAWSIGNGLAGNQSICPNCGKTGFGSNHQYICVHGQSSSHTYSETCSTCNGRGYITSSVIDQEPTTEATTTESAYVKPNIVKNGTKYTYYRTVNEQYVSSFYTFSKNVLSYNGKKYKNVKYASFIKKSGNVVYITRKGQAYAITSAGKKTLLKKNAKSLVKDSDGFVTKIKKKSGTLNVTNK